jgi:hypothetical protein
VLLASRAVLAQCTSDNPLPFDRRIGQTQLHCEYLPEEDLRKWTITRPNVAARMTEYSDISFKPGEYIHVYAQGCVNIGPGNKTDWRRYVDPEGPGTDRFFHGLIWIPGARQQGLSTSAGTAPVPISAVSDSNETVWLQIEKPTQEITQTTRLDREHSEGIRKTLRLGYESDYRRKHEMPGDPYAGNLPTKGQCRMAEGAKEPDVVTVTVMITTKPHVSPRRLLTFDPVATLTDENGFMFSPQWFGNYVKNSSPPGLQVTDECDNFPYKNWLRVSKGVTSSCTKQAAFDFPQHLFTECLLAPGFGELHGHVNWAPATFVGKLGTQDLSADGDVDLQLISNEEQSSPVWLYPGTSKFEEEGGGVGRILTADSQFSKEYRDALWMEFASYETTNYFFSPSTDDSWNNLLQGRYKGRTAVVTGLLNLDCVHDCHAELHPVLAMAVRTKSESESNIKNDDSWAIFVRDAGNEGDCSSDEHYLNRDAYTFFLPAPREAAEMVPSVTNATEAFRSNVSGLTWSLVRTSGVSATTENGVLLRFSFAPTECADIHAGKMIHISGVLHLNWSAVESPEPEACNPQRLFAGIGPDSRLDPPLQAIYPVCRSAEASQLVTCAQHEDDFSAAEIQLSAFHESHHPGATPSKLESAVKDFLWGELGLYPEVLLYNKTSQIQINPGFRYAPIQTSLFSFEVDGDPGLSRSVKSTNGQNLSVRLSDFLYGFKIQFWRQLNMFAETKGGLMFRSASAGFASTPDFERFHGHDAFFMVGGGIQPGTQARTFGNRVSIRISVGYLYFPGTSEHMVRLTVGPQFQFHKKGE